MIVVELCFDNAFAEIRKDSHFKLQSIHLMDCSFVQRNVKKNRIVI